ncbi:ABC transporter substrate-binding protein [Pseudomonas sp. HAR-UPW-AIA-41]|uniref:substrate-binding periplasmic protein n=1 Tax=Pseudomonas sp. HAR-UPW-AIA-41 TaxID=1985301 RepID=UPI000BB3871A|nr:transporter substrate-binding domain-containing protein [Pseudomonas sp. HAR-UPW-AIA-41]PAV49492.1 ABC transporter substrate-binding protein [Pseudomonas sp. HAR-UPW-AIA-41]
MPHWLSRCSVLALSLSVLLSQAEPLQLYTEEYPPVSFSVKGRAEGMANELVRELLKRLGESGEISVVPWARGYHTVQQTPNTALFATIRNAEREPLFRWVGPILLAQDSFYALKNSGIQLHDLADVAKAGPVAVPRDWFSYQELRNLGLTNLLGVTEPEQMFKMLKRGRVKLIVADNLSFYSTGDAAQQVDYLTAKDVEVALPYRASLGYITFWHGTDPAVIQRWQRELDAMKADGSFSRIYQRWLPGEPEP